MFVKTTRRRRGDKVYEYLALVESVREGRKVKHRTLLRLEEVTALRQSGQLERIVAALERHLCANGSMSQRWQRKGPLRWGR